LGALVFLGLGALLLAPASDAQDPYKRAVLIAVAVLLASFVLVLRASTGGATPRAVRLATDGVLRFVPSRHLAASYLFCAVVGLSPGLLSLVGGVSGEVGPLRRSPELISALALAWLAHQAWSLRRPSGLTVSPEGLTGVRHSKAVLVTWDELAGARAETTARGAVLTLDLVGDSPLVIPYIHLGSDPNLVAAIIEHFRVEADERALLANGLDAVIAVEEASPPRPERAWRLDG
jgi:hypothetical protein